MRLSKIKLAGFKSFVDPTHVPFPTNLTGVVGPNGCGKSNIIDAVRWVMGESSAKNLRGESMTDVIFNGSTSRQPIGQASIELRFDNSDGALGGQYAAYNEIAIRRTVSRDGQSQYFLNDTKCRRRDITDVFLGTGLGPRSYAIIEQGTISRLIEARPEELRIFLEEAAGISKYKARRKETELRIRHTYENLERLSDLRQELDKQINHLHRQAKTAERYRELKQEERRMKGELLALRWQAIDRVVTEQQRQIQQQERALDQHYSHQRHAETAIIELRESHIVASDSLNQIQGDLYEVGSAIARIQQSIQHAEERIRQQQQERAQLDQRWGSTQQQLQADQLLLDETCHQITLLEPEAVLLMQLAESQLSELHEVEEANQQWQQQWDRFNQRAAEPLQQAQVERARIQQLEQQSLQLEQRLRRIEDERAQLSTVTLIEELEELALQVAELSLSKQDRIEALEAVRLLLQRQRELNQQQQQLQLYAQRELQAQHGRVVALEALQQAALGGDEAATTEWLATHGLDHLSRLAELIQPHAGWEMAIELVLQHFLEARCLPPEVVLSELLADLCQGQVALMRPLSAGAVTPVASHPTLMDKMRSTIDLAPLLTQIWVAEDLEQAEQMVKQCPVGVSVITPRGEWLGGNWVRVQRGEEGKVGILQRQQQLEGLREQLAQQQQQLDQLELQFEATQQQLFALEEQREAQQQGVNELTQTLSTMESNLRTKEARQEQISHRAERLAHDHQELLTEIAEGSEALAEARQLLHAALEQQEGLALEREQLQARRDALHTALNELRLQSRESQQQAHQSQLHLTTLKSRQLPLEQAVARSQLLLEGLAEQREEMEIALHTGEEPIQLLHEEQEEQLGRRIDIEQRLHQAREQVTALDLAIRQQEGARLEAERKITHLRQGLEGERLVAQEQKVRQQTQQEQLQELGLELEKLLAGIPTGAEVSVWERILLQTSERISRLGPINLAAIDEYETQKERKIYLDNQNDDLVSALSTLEGAIQKIDRETRSRFRATFEQVNLGLQQKFPRLFGGGHAYLELTGDDLLDTGVTVMARPPGKRNSTIHLLSGGEKALTAVALVFAIFELNPSPFCMLDEVDAPLDEANVGRFCSLVREMSERVQFIFITHNKTTMELASSLCGVTMHEPGVSRLVAVDVDEAAELVAV